MYLTINNQEWISSLAFKYHDWKITRFAYAPLTFGEGLDPEAKEVLWNELEAIEKYPAEMTEEEIKKKEDEKAKVIENETFET